MMAKEYRCKPSEILNIESEYAAYCFNEVAFYLLGKATDEEGNVDLKKINWKKDEDEKPKNNKGFIASKGVKRI